MMRPFIYLGLDIGVRRDTAAIAGVYPVDGLQYAMCGLRVFDPRQMGKEVEIPRITDFILHLMRTQRIAGLWYDPYQYIGEAQRIRREGFGRLLHEVNQQSESTAFTSSLKSVMDAGSLWLLDDPVLSSHFDNADVTVGERGWRIVKRHQAQKIDAVVALAMSVYGAISGSGEASKFERHRNVRSLKKAA
jgi:phage terminase large subunit-like protein